MAHPTRISGGVIRRLLALAVAVGQFVGTIGIIPARVDAADNSSTPYPCKGHPCGCRTAAQCWSGACCCFTMREKVAWAVRNGMAPPEHAVRLAADEAARGGHEHSKGVRSCCEKELANSTVCDRESKANCSTTEHNCDTPRSTHVMQEGQKPHSSDRRVDWVASLFAKKCQGDGGGALGLLNIGMPPKPPLDWTADLVFVEICQSFDRIPVPIATAPQSPPPRG